MKEERIREANDSLSYAMTIGEQLLAGGAEVSRVEDTIKRLCKAFGAQRVDVFTITSSIIVTISSEEFGVLTQTRRIEGMQYDMHRLERLNQLSRKLCDQPQSMSLPQIEEQLRQIEAEKGYSFCEMLVLYALVSASFSVFFGGSAKDAIASALIGMMLKCLQHGLAVVRINHFLSTFICSILGGLGALLLVKIGLGESAYYISIGNIMLLIPGIALTNGIRDMFSGDTISGLLRFAEALLLSVVIAFAFVMASVIAG